MLGFYEDDAFVLLFYLLCMIVLCMCCLSSVIKNNVVLTPLIHSAVKYSQLEQSANILWRQQAIYTHIIPVKTRNDNKQRT